MSLRKKSTAILVMTALCGLLLALMLRASAQQGEQARAIHIREVGKHNDAASAAAFESILPVLRHPRCMNCHSSGDFPRQGDDGHRHAMEVRRGPGGQGVNAVKCSTCHQDHNLVGLHMPPGAPGWELPPSATPMIWEGLSDRQLCELFKDPKQNGHRNAEQIVGHMHTPLVLWGWSPGEGRSPVPMPQSEFLTKVKEWAAKGAACPTGLNAGGAPERLDAQRSTPSQAMKYAPLTDSKKERQRLLDFPSILEVQSSYRGLR